MNVARVSFSRYLDFTDLNTGSYFMFLASQYLLWEHYRVYPTSSLLYPACIVHTESTCFRWQWHVKSSIEIVGRLYVFERWALVSSSTVSTIEAKIYRACMLPPWLSSNVDEVLQCTRTFSHDSFASDANPDTRAWDQKAKTLDAILLLAKEFCTEMQSWIQCLPPCHFLRQTPQQTRMDRHRH